MKTIRVSTTFGNLKVFDTQGNELRTVNHTGLYKTTEYYGTAVLWAVENGITNGTSATTFDPEATCTRAQVVTFLYRDIAR